MECWTFLWELVKIIIISVALIIPIRIFLIQPFYVQGASMFPNFIQNDYLIVDEITYGVRDPLSKRRILGGRPPRRGEIVVFSCAMASCGPSQNDFLIKRVIGLPGETVVLKEGRVAIISKDHPDGFWIRESYLPPSQGWGVLKDMTVQLSPREYFVLGDNRANSFDSEDFGAIEDTAIIGRVWLRGWPFNRLTSFTVPSY